MLSAKSNPAKYDQYKTIKQTQLQKQLGIK